MATSLTKISIKDSSSWNSFLDLIYPIGSLYFSSNSTSPATRFGGTWSALHASTANSARYLKLGPWGAGGDNTILVDNMPSHKHALSVNYAWSGWSGTSPGAYMTFDGPDKFGEYCVKNGWSNINSATNDHPQPISNVGGGQGLLSLLPLRLLLVSHRLILGWWSKWLPR